MKFNKKQTKRKLQSYEDPPEGIGTGKKRKSSPEKETTAQLEDNGMLNFTSDYIFIFPLLFKSNLEY